MSVFEDIGAFIKKNGSGLLGLAGSVLTGNVLGGVNSVKSMITEATGTDNMSTAITRLRADPTMLVKLEEIAKANEADIRDHHQTMQKMEIEDLQKEHSEQQLTIRGGDQSPAEYVQETRPKIARQSWYATMTYIIGMEVLKLGHLLIVGTPAVNQLLFGGADMSLALVLLGPAGAYFGFRSADKIFKKS